MCRGNYKGMYLSEGGYTSIAERLFNRAKVNHFLLEFDTPRAGDFAPLAMMPKNKGVGARPGQLQGAAARGRGYAKKRVDEAARYVDFPPAPSARSADSPAPWAAIR